MTNRIKDRGRCSPGQDKHVKMYLDNPASKNEEQQKYFDVKTIETKLFGANNTPQKDSLMSTCMIQSMAATRWISWLNLDSLRLI